MRQVLRSPCGDEPLVQARLGRGHGDDAMATKKNHRRLAMVMLRAGHLALQCRSGAMAMVAALGKMCGGGN